jgi:hypothetical protein
MTKQIRKTKELINGVLRGLEAPSDTFRVNRYTYPHKSAQEAMRGDWRRVGDELKEVIQREDVKTAA